MTTIARNLYFERGRTRSLELASLATVEDIHDPVQDPFDLVFKQERSAVVREAIDALCAKSRKAILLSLEGFSAAEIADQMGLARGTVDVLLHRARKTLAQRLADAREKLLGGFVLVGSRIRDNVRRLTNSLWTAQPLAIAATQVGAGVMSVAIAGVVTLALPPPAEHPTATPSTASATRTSVRGTSITRSNSPINHLRPPSDGLQTTADARNQSVGASTPVRDPRTGQPSTIGVRVWHARDKQRGKIGPLLDQSSADVCASSAPSCASNLTIGGHRR